jgi:hypothetical protein
LWVSCTAFLYSLYHHALEMLANPWALSEALLAEKSAKLSDNVSTGVFACGVGAWGRGGMSG